MKEEFHRYFYGLSSVQRDAFAERCGTSTGYLKQVALGHRDASADLAMHIERESGGAIRAEIVCPDAPWEVVRGKGPVAAEEGIR